MNVARSLAILLLWAPALTAQGAEKPPSARAPDRVDRALRALNTPAPRMDEHLLDNDGVRFFLLEDGILNDRKRFADAWERLDYPGKVRLLYVVLHSRPLVYPDGHLYDVIEDQRRSNDERYLASRAFLRMRSRIDRTDCLWDGKRYLRISRHVLLCFNFASPEPEATRGFARVWAVLESKYQIFKTPEARRRRAAVIYRWIRDGLVVSALEHYRDHYLLEDVLARVEDGLHEGAVPVRQAAECFLFFEDVRRGQLLARRHWVAMCNDGHGELMDRMFRLFGQCQDADRIEPDLPRIKRKYTRQRLRRTVRILRLR